jgi:hypothetical protein
MTASVSLRMTLVVGFVLTVMCAVSPVGAETVDLEGLNLQRTVARVLTPSVPFLTSSCTPGAPPDVNFCSDEQPLFEPAGLDVTCPGPACVVQVDLCLDYNLVGTGAIGVVFVRVDGAVPVPGPEAFLMLRSEGLDSNHNLACVTQFARELSRGTHTVVVGAGVDNNFSGETVSITIRWATAVIRVYR